MINATLCPFCKTKNNCMAHADAHAKNNCWCKAGKIPNELIAMLPKESRGKACICRSCIQLFKENPLQFKRQLN